MAKIWPKTVDNIRKERREILRALEIGDRTAKEVLDVLHAHGLTGANVTRVARILTSFEEMGWLTSTLNDERRKVYRFYRKEVALRSDLYHRLQEVYKRRARGPRDGVLFQDELDGAVQEWLSTWENFFHLGEYQMQTGDDDAD